ncbi:hypothetical protein BZA05DRAFT_421304 [Tricharina praecox]|uniref:uncharacterized protein n=1 Tax=Tricharina praecox TaxID=43433 RepID=UPI00221F5BAE|nr:uncharacterized protein BZA05DRAFT_421304 [Tricharina praecox]KAI5845479.1 hypothetical protein BZA05DRAFT_421304 [Tricharina praecox]
MRDPRADYILPQRLGLAFSAHGFCGVEDCAGLLIDAGQATSNSTVSEVETNIAESLLVLRKWPPSQVLKITSVVERYIMLSSATTDHTEHHRRPTGNTIRIKVFKGIRDGSEVPEEFLDDIEFTTEQLESTAPTDKTRLRFFRQYLDLEEYASNRWNLDVPQADKKDCQKVVAAFKGKFGNGQQAGQKTGELQNGIASLAQGESESIAAVQQPFSDAFCSSNFGRFPDKCTVETILPVEEQRDLKRKILTELAKAKQQAKIEEAATSFNALLVYK